MKTVLLKSPMNYIGNKYRVLEQILPLFPQCNTFVDLFAGGLDVSVNEDAAVVYCNDINCYLIDIYRAFQENGYEAVLAHAEQRIEEYGLSKENEGGYLAFRNFYNHSERNPLDLYLLMNYGFNYQFRFNSKHEFNNPFGRNRSSFNAALQERLQFFVERIEAFKFSSTDFRDFDFSVLEEGDLIYCDPPYSLSIGSYNDGKRGFKGWSKNDDLDLMDILDSLADRGVKFALSNVTEHKGQEHTSLKRWAEKYTTYVIDRAYGNCSYHLNDRNTSTKEVLITNE